MACITITTSLLGDTKTRRFILRLRRYGNTNIPNEGSDNYLVVNAPVMQFNNVSDGRYEVGVSEIINGKETEIKWKPVYTEIPNVSNVTTTVTNNTDPNSDVYTKKVTVNWDAVSGYNYAVVINDGVSVTRTSNNITFYANEAEIHFVQVSTQSISGIQIGIPITKLVSIEPSSSDMFINVQYVKKLTYNGLALKHHGRISIWNYTTGQTINLKYIKRIEKAEDTITVLEIDTSEHTEAEALNKIAKHLDAFGFTLNSFDFYEHAIQMNPETYMAITAADMPLKGNYEIEIT